MRAFALAQKNPKQKCGHAQQDQSAHQHVAQLPRLHDRAVYPCGETLWVDGMILSEFPVPEVRQGEARESEPDLVSAVVAD